MYAHSAAMRRTTSSAVNIAAIGCHLDTVALQAMQLSVLNISRPQECCVRRVIPEIDIWRAANLILKRYGDKAIEESAARADELAAAEDHNGAAVWRRITDAVLQLANTTPTGPLH
jgi:hypothetical protein